MYNEMMDTIGLVNQADPEQIRKAFDRAMAAVLADIRNELAVPVSIGGLRRSLGALVMEQCGDPAMAQLICGENPAIDLAPFSPERALQTTEQTIISA